MLAVTSLNYVNLTFFIKPPTRPAGMSKDPRELLEISRSTMALWKGLFVASLFLASLEAIPLKHHYNNLLDEDQKVSLLFPQILKYILLFFY